MIAHFSAVRFSVNRTTRFPMIHSYIKGTIIATNTWHWLRTKSRDLRRKYCKHDYCQHHRAVIRIWNLFQSPVTIVVLEFSQ